MKSRDGFSLLEVIVAIALLGLALTIAYQILLPGMRLWAENQAAASVEQTGLLLSQHMVREMTASTRASITVRDDPAAVSFMDWSDDGGTDGYDTQTGKALWRRFVVYYLDPARHLVIRKVWPNPQLATQTPALPYAFPAAKAQPLTAEQLRLLCETPNGTEQQAGAQILSMSVGTVSGQPVVLSLHLSADAPGGPQVSDHRIEFQVQD